MKKIMKATTFVLCFLLMFMLLGGCKTNSPASEEKPTAESRLDPKLYNDTSNQGESPTDTDDAPDVVKAYKQPTALGDSWDSFTIKFDNELYSLPAPLSEFISNGIICRDDENLMIDAWNSSSDFHIQCGDQYLMVDLRNYSDNDQPAKYCFVTSITYVIVLTPIPYELPGGLSENSSADDFIEVYGEPNKTNDFGTLASCTWSDSDSGEIYILFYTDTGKIMNFTFSHEPKSL